MQISGLYLYSMMKIKLNLIITLSTLERPSSIEPMDRNTAAQQVERKLDNLQISTYAQDTFEPSEAEREELERQTRQDLEDMLLELRA